LAVKVPVVMDILAIQHRGVIFMGHPVYRIRIIDCSALPQLVPTAATSKVLPPSE